MRKTKFIEKITLIALAVLTAPGLSLFTGCSIPMEIKEMSIIMPDLEKSKEGTYQGKHDSKMVRAKVIVKLKDHSITGIELIKHDTFLGKKAETLVDSVIHYQTIELDAVSGATVSSKVLLKSIENALNKSIN